MALGWNILAWAPLVGCLIYEVPLGESGRLLTYGTVLRMLRGGSPGCSAHVRPVGGPFLGLHRFPNRRSRTSQPLGGIP